MAAETLGSLKSELSGDLDSIYFNTSPNSLNFLLKTAALECVLSLSIRMIRNNIWHETRYTFTSIILSCII